MHDAVWGEQFYSDNKINRCIRQKLTSFTSLNELQFTTSLMAT